MAKSAEQVVKPTAAPPHVEKSDDEWCQQLTPEQYAVWHLLNAPRIGGQTTVTKTDLLTF